MIVSKRPRRRPLDAVSARFLIGAVAAFNREIIPPKNEVENDIRENAANILPLPLPPRAPPLFRAAPRRPQGLLDVRRGVHNFSPSGIGEGTEASNPGRYTGRRRDGGGRHHRGRGGDGRGQGQSCARASTGAHPDAQRGPRPGAEEEDGAERREESQDGGPRDSIVGRCRAALRRRDGKGDDRSAIAIGTGIDIGALAVHLHHRLASVRLLHRGHVSFETAELVRDPPEQLRRQSVDTRTLLRIRPRVIVLGKGHPKERRSDRDGVLLGLDPVPLPRADPLLEQSLTLLPPRRQPFPPVGVVGGGTTTSIVGRPRTIGPQGAPTPTPSGRSASLAAANADVASALPFAAILLLPLGHHFVGTRGKGARRRRGRRGCKRRRNMQ
mmetsp:Transcript_2058/g.5420  ORF Transcript_2058/g.5420 Transcript_2058/m.5420 type:complete len:384 (-) Transcript_2058:226-1377(-)